MAFLVLACGSQSCRSVPQPGDAQPVIEAILLVDSSTVAINVHFVSSPDEPFGVGIPPTPIPADDVSLFLGEVGSIEVPVRLALGQPGRFEAAITVEPGRRYRLHGEVAGRPVTGFVDTPDRLVLIEPAADTIGYQTATDGSSIRIPYRFVPTAGLSRLTTYPPIGADGSLEGHWILLGAPDTLAVTIFGMERHAAELYGSPVAASSRGNIDGALGVVGAAATIERVFIRR